MRNHTLIAAGLFALGCNKAPPAQASAPSPAPSLAAVQKPAEPPIRKVEAVPDEAPPRGGKWQTNAVTSEMDDAKTSLVALEAETKIRTFRGQLAPELYFRFFRNKRRQQSQPGHGERAQRRVRRSRGGLR